MRLSLLVLTVTILFAAGCASTYPTPVGEVIDENGDVIEGNGIVQYVELEGGFYGIVDEDGIQYDPINLDDAYKEDGLRVHFLARTREDVMSAHMWGTSVEILAIERTDDRN